MRVLIILAFAGVVLANRLDELLGIRIGVEMEVKTTASRQQAPKAADNGQKTMSDGTPCPEFCCYAMTANCLACSACQTVEEYCAACLLEGLNSMGCETCPETSVPTLFPGILPVVSQNTDDTMQNNTEPSLTPCQQASQASLPPTSFVIITDQFRPECNLDGTYKEVQCHEAECWCVDVTGAEVDSTRGPRSSTFTCYSPPVMTPCQQAVAASSGLMGAYTPQCDEDGAYSSIQCHGSIGMCWCVDESGTELLGSRRTDHSVPDCSGPVAPSPSSSPVVLTLCQQAVASGSGLIGAYVPQCDDDGSYSQVQCHGSTGICWCVDDSGSELQGTRRNDRTLPQCDDSHDDGHDDDDDEGSGVWRNIYNHFFAHRDDDDDDDERVSAGAALTAVVPIAMTCAVVMAAHN